jgi:hypothetical protein
VQEDRVYIRVGESRIPEVGDIDGDTVGNSVVIVVGKVEGAAVWL